MVKTFLAICVAAAGLACGQAPNLDVKLGLWEVTTVSQTSGMPAIDTSKMSPETRARVEAAMKARASKAPTTRRECITKEKLEKNTMFNPQQANESCKRTIVTNTKSVAEVKIECQNEKYPTTGTLHFEMASREAMKGTVKMTSGPMNIDVALTGKWLGDSCGDVK